MQFNLVMSEIIGERNEEAFLKKAKDLAEWTKNKKHFYVVYNYDADGISGGAITCKALEREGKTFEHLGLKQLYKEVIEEIKEKAEHFIFVDFGSAMIKELKEHFGNNFIVMDHHQPQIEEYGYHLNPLLYGIDGGREISGSGTAYYFAKALNEKNMDLAGIAIVGALGDMQDNQENQLIGMNRKIISDGKIAEVLSVKKDLRLYGRISRPLTQFLMFSTNPILPELTGNQENCLNFLQQNEIPIKNDIEAWNSYEDLTFEQKQKLTTALILHLTEYNVSEWKIKELIGEVYTLEQELERSPLRDGKEYATLCNSCGRHGKPEIALMVEMGDRDDYYIMALDLLQEHRRQLKEGIELMQQEGLIEEEQYYYFDGTDRIQDSIIGIIAGMMYSSGLIETTKPIIAFAKYPDGYLKISGRATKELVRKGLNLGLMFREACSQLGEIAEGGGHAIAAGCRIEEKEKTIFMKMMNEIIKRQINEN